MPRLDRTAAMAIICPYCYTLVITRTRAIITRKTHTVALVLCVLGLGPLAAGVYCLKSMRDIVHYCPECDNMIGIHERFNSQRDTSIHGYRSSTYKAAVPLTTKNNERKASKESNKLKIEEISYNYVHPLTYFYSKYGNTKTPKKFAELPNKVPLKIGQEDQNFANSRDNLDIKTKVKTKSENRKAPAVAGQNLHTKFTDPTSNLHSKRRTKEKHLGNTTKEVPKQKQDIKKRTVYPEIAKTIYKRKLSASESDSYMDSNKSIELSSSEEIPPKVRELLTNDKEQPHGYTERPKKVSILTEHTPVQKHSIELLNGFKMKPTQSLDEMKQNQMELYYNESKQRKSVPKDIVKTKGYNLDETILPVTNPDAIGNNTKMLSKNPNVVLFKEAFTQTTNDLVDEPELNTEVGQSGTEISVRSTNSLLQVKLVKKSLHSDEDYEFLFENLETPVDSEVSIVTHDGSFFSTISFSDSLLDVLSDSSITSDEE
ncbi:uncharacterized protein LOC119689145 [Teleopsis dalmanni]|uniref:uncharacterized protein LOC119689145 n=1 Tax=Teleopsis dalmanni TaxID=139649 RepID=UPI0018CCD95D|nr:uncharacterized protein LOC119689145 [Teleopsis dalmanni]